MSDLAFSVRWLERMRGGLCVCLLALAPSAWSAEPLFQDETYVFGTKVQVTVYGAKEPTAKLATAEILRDFDHMHWALHAWKQGELVEINTAIAAGRGDLPVSQEVAALIRDATSLWRQSAGLFNPAIGKLVGLWNFHSDSTQPVSPDPREISRLVHANPGMGDLVLKGNMLTSKNRAVQLDFGGYAKGYALDRAAGLLRAHEIRNALIDIGGNIMALGRKGETPWHIGIKHPRRAGVLAELDLYDGEAIGTSGDYQRYFIVDGKRYSHIIDPRTGYPVPGAEAVTVLVPAGDRAGALSDGASKPLFIEGVKGWRRAAKRMGITHALLVDEHSGVHLTGQMHKRLRFVDQNIALTVE